MSNKKTFEEASKLINSLLKRTQEKKVEWFARDNNEFISSPLNSAEFIVSSTPECYEFTMHDADGHNLIDVSTQSGKEYWELEEGEQAVNNTLPDLYELARRTALNVDQKVSEISAYLDSL